MDALKIAAAALLLAGTPAVAAPTPAATSATPPSIRAGVERWRAGDYPAAVAMWQPFAASGDADAMFNMGQAYKLGRGVPQDAVQARDFYRKAALKGHLPAQANLGIALFQVGEKPEAIKWLRTAADRGEARAQYVLGIAAFNGDGLPRSQALGYGYLLRAQASGLPQAATALGSITPALSPADRSAGEAVAASLAAGTGVPAALAAATAPKLIAPAPGILKPPPAASASLPIRTPPAVEVAAAAPKPTVVAATPPKVVPTETAAPKPQVATAMPPKAAPTESAAAKPQPAASTPPKIVPAEVAAAKPVPTPTPAQADAAARTPVVAPVVATTDVPASRPADPPKPKPVAVATVAKPAGPLKPFETAAAPAPKKPDGWRVQLGAFSQRKLAEAAWAEAKPAAGSAKPIYNADGTVVKLQMGPFANRDAAKAACGKLTEAGRACFVTAG